MADEQQKGGGKPATKAEGAPADKPGKPGKPEKGDKPEKAEKPEKQAKAGKGDKGDRGAKAEKLKVGPEEKGPPPRLRERYRSEIVPALMKEFSYRTPMQVPRLRKIVLNMGLGEAVQNVKIIDSAAEELSAIAGQKPVVTRARKSIATFKLRAGAPIGVTVTLRRERMWEFLDRLLTLAIPRTRDFKGVPPRQFDGRGNFSMGIREQVLFMEINYDKVDKVKGLGVTICTTARTDREGRALLAKLGFPFRGEGGK